MLNEQAVRGDRVTLQDEAEIDAASRKPLVSRVPPMLLQYFFVEVLCWVT
ncbi:MAG: hypothetical protein WBD31_13775 [Rubripirellula sp.]